MERKPLAGRSREVNQACRRVAPSLRGKPWVFCRVRRDSILAVCANISYLARKTVRNRTGDSSSVC